MTDEAGGRTGAVVTAIRRKLAGGALMPGERLPSIRGFAATMGVSPSTVVEAYDRLAAEGLIRARPGSGFYVAGAVSPLALTEAEPRRERAIDPLWVSRQSLDAGPDMLKPGCGWLPVEWMPNRAIRRAVRGLARTGDALLTEYGAARGALSLRRHLVRRFAGEGIDASADQVLLAASGTQAIDLIGRFLLRPGEVQGDVILGFAGAGVAGGDWLSLQGFGTAATLTHQGEGLWRVSYVQGGVATSESFTVVGVTTLGADDLVWG